jgi:ABC-type branched-subunit amino acid transport system ATPase component
MTTVAMLMQEIEALPEESVAEALDFVLFLREKKSADTSKKPKIKSISEVFPGMNEPVHLGFDLKKISREELYER